MAVGQAEGGPSKLVGFDSRFKRINPKSDRFEVKGFHHIEFYCGDASNIYRRFVWGLGMQLVAKSDQTTGNQTYCSYVLKSNDLTFLFTAPYSSRIDQSGSRKPLPNFDAAEARGFFSSHGLGVKSVGILVADAFDAFDKSTKNGAIAVTPPMLLKDDATNEEASVAEVRLYGDVVLRFVSYDNFSGPFLPNYERVDVSEQQLTYGLTRLDHCVGNVPHMLEAVRYIKDITGFHDFAEFTAEDVGTVDSGLNSTVVASNNEMVLLPVNEPTFGTKRKSQIQTYLEHNEGPGVQHLALMSSDIFSTLKEMRLRTQLGGFSFMPRPNSKYYMDLPARIGSELSASQLKDCEELGILVDRDDQGVLLQIFTEPIGDRPTIFIEIIQRVGCVEKGADGKEFQRGGCGGFGKGNFGALFKSIEDYEKTLDGTSKQ